MKKLLLTAMLFPAMAMMAEAPQTSFFLSGFNGIKEASGANTLVYTPAEDPDELAEDEADGMYRYKLGEFTVESCENGFTIVGAEGMTLGYIEDNLLESPNNFGGAAPMMYIGESSTPINSTLAPGRYSVALTSFNNFEGEGFLWLLSFTSLDKQDDVLAYYLLGFDGEDEGSQSNQFIEETVGEGDEETTMYVYPKFLIGECPEGFTVTASDGTVYGGTGEVNDENPFAMLSADGEPMACTLAPGYYTVNFAPMGFMNMVSFIRCEDQAASDESEYYLLGFNGVNAPDDSMKFVRTVVTEEYEDEDTGEVETYEGVIYKIEKIDLQSCPDGFTVSTEDGGFRYGLYDAMKAFFSTVTDESPAAMLGIYGAPYGWEMTAGEYTVSFSPNGANGGFMTFEPYEDSAVGEIEADGNEAPVYYNLQGVRVANPEKGVYIRKCGRSVSKVIL